MNLSGSDSLIQAVLDGDATAAQRAELDRLLTADPALRAKYESLKRVCSVLDAVPEVDPPAGLVECVLVRATLPESPRAAPRQSLLGEGVAAKDARPKRPTEEKWFSGLVNFLKEIGMSGQKTEFLGSTKRKFLVLAGVAAVALVGVSSVIDFPIGGSNTAGTIVPAERHRAPQNSADDIKVGVPGAVQPNQAGGAVSTGSAANDAAGSASRVAAGVAANDAAGSASRVAAGVAANDAAGSASRVAAGVAAANASAAAQGVAANVAAAKAQGVAANVAAANASATAQGVAAGNAAANAAANAAGSASALKQ